MKILKQGLDYNDIFDNVRKSDDRILITDYDGTLAPFNIDRDKAFPFPWVYDILRSIMQSDHSRVVIVSGRSIDDLKPFLDFDNQPEIWGCHGWERMMPDGSYTVSQLSADVSEGLEMALRVAMEAGLRDRCEKKPACLALHWRGEERRVISGIRNGVGKHWERVAEEKGLSLHEFDGGIELRPPGKDKGKAVEAVLEESGERAAAVYLGDDATDEDAFRAVNPKGIGILVNSAYRPTSADIWLEPPDELFDFLREWSGACGGQ